MLEQALSHWQQWGLSEEPRFIRYFTEGKNHTTGLIESADHRYVLKRFNHSIDGAIKAQRHAAEYGIAPNVYYHDAQLCLMDYIAHTPPSLEQLARALNVLHTQVKCNAPNLDLILFYDEYLVGAPETLKRQHQTLLPILNEFINDPTPWCFCHNDLVNENCLGATQLTTTNIEGGASNTAVFIDWEFAAQHNPWFDLAAIVLYQDLNDVQAAQFLHAYKGWKINAERRIFLTSQIALLWGDLLWHICNFGHSYQAENTHRFAKLDTLIAKLGAHC